MKRDIASSSSSSNEGEQAKKPKVDLMVDVKQQFQEFSKYMDVQLDKRELVNRLTREMTLESKKFIYTLQKHAHSNLSQLKSDEQAQEHQHLDRLRVLMQELDEALGCERNRCLFQRSVSAGLQEMIEALTLHYFIFTAPDLISIREMRTLYHFNDLQWLQVEPLDYLLGCCDLTGELMRFAITTIPKHFENAESIHRLLQQIHAETQKWTGLISDRKHLADLQQKLQVMQANCQKVEQSIFEAILTRKEFPDINDENV